MENKRKNLDVSQSNGKLFGLDCNFEGSETIFLPLPWEVSVSYGSGTAKGPNTILEASAQIDLHDPLLAQAWERGLFLLDESEEWKRKGQKARTMAIELIRIQEAGGTVEADNKQLQEVNAICEEFRLWVFEESLKIINAGKDLALLGGDHSCPLGFIQALSTKHEAFGVLQIDAHADLREAYEGFVYSHASIMHNVLKLPNVIKLCVVGLRDLSTAENEVIEQSDMRIESFRDDWIQARLFDGTTWKAICDAIIGTLPQKVYISFDIDGLKPEYCPGTGTPVPGGLELEQVMFLFHRLVEKGHQILGFDLSEVAPSQRQNWDGNVGARILYRLSNLMALSKKKP